MAALAAAAPAPGETPAAGTTLDVVLMLSYLGAAIVLSFLCSIAESALLSMTPSYIAGLRSARPRLADQLWRLRLGNIDRSLAAILTLNTIAHTAGAVGSGAKATVVFGSAWVGVFSAVATLLILFLSEIVPKTLGALYWRRLAVPTMWFIRVLIVLLYPLIRVSELLTRLLARGHEGEGFNREEFLAMAGMGEASGDLDPRESRILRNLFGMSTLRTWNVMTPRTVIASLAADTTVEAALADARTAPFSRIPVFTRDIDDVAGFVLRDELRQAEATGRGREPVSALARPLLTVADSMPLSGLLEFLLEKRQQLALVVGEYGDTVGLVTLEDVVETLLGDEIVDERDRVSDMQRLARERWERRAARHGIVWQQEDEESGSRRASPPE
ncbi:CNNM domain-containing protein [Luteimonas saliphila]|uniref:CNNM domain-containing protein n=1 Tax=Luteimonas saliphila TaxID=2804919 RepID=UPI00192D2280|nr:hemolysin family protein [Luteimonas saliphila]